MQEDYSKYTHNRLIEKLAQNPENRSAWNEFYKRYHHFICSTIYKISRELGYREGIDNMEDLAQEVYKKLIKNNFQALKDYKGEHDNTIFKYLKIIIIRIILNKQKEDSAQRRIPQKITISIDEPPKAAESAKEQSLGNIEKPRNHRSILDLMVLREDIEFCLNKIFSNNKQKVMYQLILKCHIFKGFDSRLIVESLEIDRSQKTVSNIISKTMPSLRTCLEQRMKEN